MLSLETPATQVGDLLVFADHAVPTAFYYAAPNPRISHTGVGGAGPLMFDLFSYAVELEHSPLAGTQIPTELGAGFLTLGVDCRADSTQLGRAKSELSTKLGLEADAISLAPIPYTKGTATLIALDAATAPPPGSPRDDGRPQFVESIVGGGTPSLLGDLRAIFSLSLSQEGVTFLEGVYADGAAPIGVVYELTFLGLRPSVECRITADLSRIYSELGGNASVGCQYFRGEVDALITHLAETSAITIELVSEAVGADAQKSKELALSMFKDNVVQQFFKPTAQPPQLPNFQGLPGAQKPQTSIVSLSLRKKDTEELKTITYDYSERSPEERTHAPQGFLSALLSKDEMAGRIHRVNLDSQFFELLEVLVTGPTEEELAALSLRGVTVDITYGKDSDPVPPETETLLFRPGSTGDKTFAVKRRGRPSMSYSVTTTYEFTRAGAAVDSDVLTYTVGPVVKSGRTLSVRPYDDFGVLDVEVEVGRVDASVTTVDVALSYADPVSGFAAGHDLRLPVADPGPVDGRSWQVRTRGQGGRAYTAVPTFTFDDGAVLTGPAETTDSPLLRVDTPFQATRTLLVQPNVSAADVTQVTVEIAYDDDAAGYHRRFSRTLAPAADTRAWSPVTLSWPILDGARQSLRYRVTTLAGGTVDTVDWTATDEPSLLVGETGRRKRSLEVRLVGPALADAGLDAVQVQVLLPGAPEETATSLFFDATTPVSQTASLPATADVPPGFRYQVVAFHADGTQKTSTWLTTTTGLAVVQTRTI